MTSEPGGEARQPAASPAASAPEGPASVWGNRDFRRLWSASIGSAVGSHITGLAIPFLAILSLGATPWQIGMLSIARQAPTFITGLAAGPWIDRHHRRPLMIGCDLARALLLLTIPVAAWWDALTFAQLLIVVAAISVATSIFEIADRSMLPSIVGRDQLLDANRLLTAGQTTAETVGFSSAGWLVQWLTGPVAIVIDAATFVWSAVMLRRIERTETISGDAGDRASLGTELGQGLRAIRGDTVLSALAASRLLLAIGVGAIGTVYLIFVNQELGLSPGLLGLLFAAGGLFSIAGSLAANRTAARFGIGPALAWSLLLLAAGQATVTIAVSATLVAIICILIQQAFDLFWTTYEIGEISLRQAATPDRLLGRVNGTFGAIEVGGSMVGALVGGWIGSNAGSRAAILAGSVVIALGAVPLLSSRVRKVRQLPPLATSAEAPLDED